MTACSYCSLIGEHCLVKDGAVCQRKLKVLHARIDSSNFDDGAEVQSLSGVSLNVSLPASSSVSKIFHPLQRFFSLGSRHRRRNSEGSNPPATWKFNPEKPATNPKSSIPLISKAKPGCESSQTSYITERRNSVVEQRNRDIDLRTLKRQMSSTHFPKKARRGHLEQNEFRQQCLSFLSPARSQSVHTFIENPDSNQTADETTTTTTTDKPEHVYEEVDESTRLIITEAEEYSRTIDYADSVRNLENVRDKKQANSSPVKKNFEKSYFVSVANLKIFQGLYEDLGKALLIFDHETRLGQEEFVSLFKIRSMTSETGVIGKFLELKEMVKQGLFALNARLSERDFNTLVRSPIGKHSLRPLPRTPGKVSKSFDTVSIRSYGSSKVCSPPGIDDSGIRQTVTLSTFTPPPRKLLDRSASSIEDQEIPVGLFNRDGKMCYVNAGLQLLLAVPEIQNFLRKGMEAKKKAGHTSLSACNTYLTFMENRKRAMANPRRCPISSLTIAKLMFLNFPRVFKAGEQNDCEEFVTKLLEVFHKELGDENSPRRLFRGIQKRFTTTELLPTRQNKDATSSSSVKVEEFTTVHLHFAPRHKIIEDCFDTYTSKQRSMDTNASHWCKFVLLPHWLLVHVQSFVQTERKLKKAQRKFTLSDELRFKDDWMYKAREAEEKAELPSDAAADTRSVGSGDMDEETSGAAEVDDRRLYFLRAVVFHSGDDTTSGHYMAAVPGKQGLWYLCSDNEVTLHTLEELDQMAATDQVTLLLYERKF